jgi:alpha-glucosidase (family GH31 glycosyl hydrolase)
MRILLGVLLVFSLVLPASGHNPIANSKAVVLFGNARFTILTPELIRMEYNPTKKFEDKASLVFINRNLPVPTFNKEIKGNTLYIHTENVDLKFVNNGQAFNIENLEVSLTVAGKKVVWNPEAVDTLNLKGTARTLDQVNGWSQVKKLENGLLSRTGWSLVDDSKTHLFDGATDWDWVASRTDTSETDLYLFAHGHHYKQALLDFTKVAGRIPMVPKYALGYWWSRYWIYSDSEYRDLVREIKSLDIPIDVLIIDMDWHETYGFSGNNLKLDPMGQWLGWSGYTWNKDLFPNPQQFLSWTNKEKLKTALNLHPASGISPMEEKYLPFAAKYGFDTTGHKYIPFAMSDKKWAKTYFDVVLNPMEKQGVDFWWLDWQQYLQDKQIKGLSNTWWLNYTFFTNMEKQGVKRPMLFHRWGGLGNHRYQIGFSGDAFCTWETLDYETYFTATASNVGYGYWSHDIGGHITKGPTQGEMYLRWIQFGVFSPILRTHASKISVLERKIWKFPEQFDAMRGAIHLRYSLVPYIYKYAKMAYDTGISICRPMYYDFPAEDAAYQFKTQYMFGDDILVSPISTPVASENFLAEKTIWLPEGEWFEFNSGTFIKGNTVVKRKFSQEEIPYYVKAGSIVPMYPKIENLQGIPPYQILAFFPGKEKSATQLYDDDGASDAYKSGQFSTRMVSRENKSDHEVHVVIDPVKGSYKGQVVMPEFEVQLHHSGPAKSVKVNGVEFPFSMLKQKGCWSYAIKDFYISIPVVQKKANEKIDVVVLYEESLSLQKDILNGNKGFLNRMSWVIEQLKFVVADKDWGGTLPNQLYEIGNVVNKGLYDPKVVLKELEKLNASKKGLSALFANIPFVDAAKVKPLVAHLELEK